MPHEAIGEILGGILEVGVNAATDSDRKTSGIGCLLMTVILVLIIGGVYYVTTQKPSRPIHGLVTKKLPNDKMVIKTEKGEDVFSITHELYLNKREGDSIILNK
jgi:hypothetical protein